MSRKPYRKNPEGITQKRVLNFLDAIERRGYPIYYFRSSSGKVKTEKGNFFSSGRTGCPDITLLVNGTFIGIELKSKVGTQREGQKEAQDLIEKAGGKYYLVRDPLELKKILSEYINIS